MIIDRCGVSNNCRSVRLNRKIYYNASLLFEKSNLHTNKFPALDDQLEDTIKCYQ